ncbi:MAG TPA: hypothetical protein VE933_02990 [Chitinophagaceae bacterium]|nr:hypothetical protein [Chitinophagaceae bacterium]
MENKSNKDVKTGAVVCVVPDRDNSLGYEARIFIKDIPGEVSDDMLEAVVRMNKNLFEIRDCRELLFRADVHATSNEVQEQLEHLHEFEKPVPEISYHSLFREKS